MAGLILLACAGIVAWMAWQDGVVDSTDHTQPATASAPLVESNSTGPITHAPTPATSESGLAVEPTGTVTTKREEVPPLADPAKQTTGNQALDKVLQDYRDRLKQFNEQANLIAAERFKNGACTNEIFNAGEEILPSPFEPKSMISSAINTEPLPNGQVRLRRTYLLEAEYPELASLKAEVFALQTQLKQAGVKIQ